jgi:hypothetical protein
MIPAKKPMVTPGGMQIAVRFSLEGNVFLNRPPSPTILGHQGEIPKQIMLIRGLVGAF